MFLPWAYTKKICKASGNKASIENRTCYRCREDCPGRGKKPWRKIVGINCNNDVDISDVDVDVSNVSNVSESISVSDVNVNGVNVSDVNVNGVDVSNVSVSNVSVSVSDINDEERKYNNKHNEREKIKYYIIVVEKRYIILNNIL